MKISKLFSLLAAASLAFSAYGCDKGEAIGGCTTATDCPDASIFECNNGACQEVNAEHCSDREKNQDETDIDCGGNDCTKCKAGKSCKVDNDCMSQKCEENVCVTASCESDKDCAENQTCESGVCATCSDEKLNNKETDVDCGGEYCMACRLGKSCELNTDCASGICTEGVCSAPSCEKDSDCREGETCDTESQNCISCKDGTKNGTETDIDCGGSCNKCATSKGCETNSDCISGICSPTDFICLEKAAATCTDGEKNGTETDKDCGGGTCPLCGQERLCLQNSDCKSGICIEGYCKGDDCSSAAAGTIVINEVFTHPDTSANMLHAEATKQLKYIEIYNTSDAIVNLAELNLEVKGTDASQTLKMSGCIDAKRYIVLHDTGYEIQAMAEGASQQKVEHVDTALAATTAYKIQLKRDNDIIHAVSVPDMSSKKGVSAALSNSPVETDGYNALVEHDTLPGEGGVENPHSPGVYNYAGAPQG